MHNPTADIDRCGPASAGLSPKGALIFGGARIDMQKAPKRFRIDNEISTRLVFANKSRLLRRTRVAQVNIHEGNFVCFALCEK